MRDKLREQTKVIIQAIRSEEQMLRDKYAFLSHQNTIGMLILLFSASTMIGLGSLYYYKILPAWLVIILIAMVASISHELEHDLIHRQYFSKMPLLHNFMMLMVWLMRPNTVNPWFRRHMHLHHHQVSGTEQDLEERLVGNGIKNPLKRLIVIMDGLLGLVLFSKSMKKRSRGLALAKCFMPRFQSRPATLLFSTA